MIFSILKYKSIQPDIDILWRRNYLAETNKFDLTFLMDNKELELENSIPSIKSVNYEAESF